MNITIDIIQYRNIVNIVVAIKVKVVDDLVRIVEASLKSLECCRFPEQVHYSVKIQVITWQTKIFLRIVLRLEHAACC